MTSSDLHSSVFLLMISGQIESGTVSTYYSPYKILNLKSNLKSKLMLNKGLECTIAYNNIISRPSSSMEVASHNRELKNHTQ